MGTIHQSDLASLSRCMAQLGYRKAGLPTQTNSAAAYGSVVHYAILQVLERLLKQGVPFEQALRSALETFAFYWVPANIEAICEPVPADGWLPQQSYSTLRTKGLDTIRKYADLIRYDEHELLATEYAFIVPIEGTWDYELNEPHWLAGAVDRLAARHYSRKLVLAIDDLKGLALDTQLPTPTGWTTMQAVQVGDELLGSDGTPCVVIGKSKLRSRDCYRVSFDDGTSVVCDDDHRWSVVSGRHCRPQTVDTRWLAGHLRDGRRVPQCTHRILNAEALVLPEAELPIDPYVLGAWLGDGKHTSGEVTKPDDELFAAIEACGYRVGGDISSHNHCQTRTVYGLSTQLRKAGLLGHKRIPDIYLRASLHQRLALLQGLMDTDGTWNRPRQQASFTSTDKALSLAVQELAISLGAKARLWEVTRSGFGLTVTAFDVTFSPVGFNPFRLPRKANLVRDAKTNARRRVIVSVDRTIDVPTQCISVDSADNTYLCGEQMVPTHNTGVQPPNLRFHVQFSAYAYASTTREFWVGARGEDGFGEKRGQQLFDRFSDAARRGTWINLRTIKFQDAGWRGPVDYERFKLAVQQYFALIAADVFPLSISGENCTYCDFRRVCGGTGLPDADHGRPGSPS